MKTSLSVLGLLVALSAPRAVADPISYSTEYTRDGYIEETISVNVTDAIKIAEAALTIAFDDSSLFVEAQEELSGGDLLLGAEDSLEDSLGEGDDIGDGEPSDLSDDYEMTVTEEATSQIQTITDKLSGSGLYIGMNDGSEVSEAAASALSTDGTLQFSLSKGMYAVLAISVGDLIPAGRSTSDFVRLRIETSVGSTDSCITSMAGWLCTGTAVYALGGPGQTTEGLEKGDTIGDVLLPMACSEPDTLRPSSLGKVISSADDYLLYIWKTEEEGEPVTLSVSTLEGLLIPEPTTATLSLWALTALAARRRRK